MMGIEEDDAQTTAAFNLAALFSIAVVVHTSLFLLVLADATDADLCTSR